MTTDVDWMRRAIELAWLCPKTDNAFAVGAVIVDEHGHEIATGYSRETDPKIHAEESALTKLGDDPKLTTSTIYSTLEPCSQRTSRPKPCLQLIREAGIPRVVIAWREPNIFVENCVGVEELRSSGIEVVELSELADAAMAPNSHLNLAS